MKIYKCVCEKEFNNGRSLQAHERTCKKYKNYKNELLLKQQQEKESKRLPNGMFICENCGKEHDGSFSSGRFCSKSCYKSYASKGGSSQTGNLSEKKIKHLQKLHTMKHKNARSPYGTWQCKKCNIIFETRADLLDHIHKQHPIQKNSSWIKGLTKENDERVALMGKHISESYKQSIKQGYVNPTWTNEYWTDEQRKIYSDKKKILYKEYPEKHPNKILALNRCQISYPEKIAYDWLVEHQIKFISQYFYSADNVNRYVDFYIPSKNLFIEIDGEYWHKEGNEVDKIKDKIALDHNIQTLRIRYPSMNIIHTLEKEFFN